jgi:large subunit ribosomal protein L4
VKRLALLSAFSDRAASSRVAVIDTIHLPEIKTKAIAELLAKMELSGKNVLILAGKPDEKLVLSARNIPNVIVMPAREANAYTVLAADWLLLTKDGLSELEEVFA